MIGMDYTDITIGTIFNKIFDKAIDAAKSHLIEEVHITVGADKLQEILKAITQKYDFHSTKKHYSIDAAFDENDITNNELFEVLIGGHGIFFTDKENPFRIFSLECSHETYIWFKFIKGSFRIEDFVSQEILKNKKSGNKRFHVSFVTGMYGNHQIRPYRTNDGDKEEEERLESFYYDISPKVPFYNKGNTLNKKLVNGSTYIVPEYLKPVMRQIKIWLDSADFYRSIDATWKRGILLYGPPGTGKTSFVRHVGITYDLPVYSFDLKSFSNNSELMSSFNDISTNTPCIVLFEDIDRVFDVDKPTKQLKDSTLSSDGLLNLIDGAKQNDGILTFITTNHIEKVSDALRRSGRMDMVVKVEDFSESERISMVKNYMYRYPRLIDDTIEETKGMVPSDIKEYCIKKNLEELWDGK